MTLEADQAVQEARFARACHNQHAGRPAPSLGWPGERKSIVQQAETSDQGDGASQGLGAQGLGPRAWGRGLQALEALCPGLGKHQFRRSGKVSWREAGEGVGDG